MAKRILGRSRKYGNKYIKVSEEDYKMLSQYSWTIEKSGRRFYAATRINDVKIRMHRLLLQPKKTQQVDHINHNGLDNRRENIRFSTHIQNMRNRERTNKRKQRYKGVCYHKRLKKYQASICYNKRRYYLGSFKLARDAAKAYNEAALKYFKEFAVLNKI